MEELLQHCMRELAFDGDLGCDISRLRSFIQNFYASQQSPGPQTVDDTFQNFVWDLLVQQPSVRVGLVPQGGTIEVYIAPQQSKRKAADKPRRRRPAAKSTPFPAVDGHDATDDHDTETSPRNLSPIPEAATCPLESLVEKYGDALRVAVDPETCFRAITGSHTRPAKLSPMVYTALQLISRGRETGLSMIDLGKKTGYDQKTCFYLVQQLLSLDLVVKLARGGPGGGNFCIHKYFYTQSPFWEGVRREGNIVQEDDHEEDSAECESLVGLRPKVQFDPIDSRHLTSSQLIKSRMIKLLNNSENGLHLYHNLIVSIGFVNPTKRDRRFFVIRIRELIKEKVIEKVIVPHMQGSSKALCIRLVADPRNSGADDIVVQSGDVGDEEQYAETPEDQAGILTPIMNMTVHMQILKLLERAGSEGLTLNDISTRLGMFDKRTIELFLYRLERYPPPSHLTDLAVCDFIENEGRERRHRYYSLTGYLSFVHNENIDDAGRTTQYTSMDLSRSGGFNHLPVTLFYRDPFALNTYVDEYCKKSKPGGSTRRIGRPRKEVARLPTVASANLEQPHTTTNPVSKPTTKGKKLSQPIIQPIEDQVQPTQENIIRKGTKRKRRDDSEQGASSSGPLAKKKKLGRLKETLQRDESLVGIMEVEDDMPALSPDGRENHHSGISPVPLIESMNIQGAVSDSAEPRMMTFTQNLPNSSVPSGHPDVSAVVDNSVIDPICLLDPVLRENIPGVENISTVENIPTVESVPAVENIPVVETTTLLSGDTSVSGPLNPVMRLRAGRTKRSHELVNISQLRAENEIIRVVEKSGGIANVSSKEFMDTYTQVVSTMTEAGEPTSMPVGTQPDRRTIQKILEKLVDRGKLKTLTVVIPPRLLVQPRGAKLIYDPSVTQERLDAYVSSLQGEFQTTSVSIHKTLDQPMLYSRVQSRVRGSTVGKYKSGQDGENWRSIPFFADDEGTRSRFPADPQAAAEARRQAEADWDALVSHVHPTPLPYGTTTRMNGLRMRYLRSKTDMTVQQWETAVAVAISTYEERRWNVVLPDPVSRDPPQTALTPVAHPEQRSVKEPIERYKDRATLTRPTTLSKKRRKGLPAHQSKMDFMWSLIGDELREKTLLGEAFSVMQAALPTTVSDSHSNGVAEAALKMTLATPENEYNAEAAAQLLNGVGKDEVRSASEDLLSRGVLSQVGDGHRKAPGRNLRISDLNEEASRGPFPANFFLDACTMENDLEDWRECSLVAAGSEMAAFVELASDGKVEFQINVSEVIANLQELDWNSKKVDDDQIETALTVRFDPYTKDCTTPSESPSETSVALPSNMKVYESNSTEHGLGSGVPVSCRRSSKGIITCSACIDREQKEILSQVEAAEISICLHIMDLLGRTGPDGLSFQILSSHFLEADVCAAVCRLTSLDCPLCYWVGYDQPVLVSRRHIRSWSLSIPGWPPQLVFPRRWLNIKGEKMENVWKAGLRAVIGVLVGRPGLSQADLRHKLLSVYDRQELNDLLAHLLTENILEYQVSPEDKLLSLRDFRGIGGSQEQKIYWSLGANTWYQVDE